MTDLIEALAGVAENMRALLDLVDGHRAQCIERGYSPTAAEAMAMDVHHNLVAAAFAGTKGSV